MADITLEESWHAKAQAESAPPR